LRTVGRAAASAKTHNLIGATSCEAVVISFSDIRLQRLCESGAALSARFGTPVARGVQAHLATLLAVDCLDEMRNLPGRCRIADGLIQLNLPEDHRIDFVPLPTGPLLSEQNWTGVRAVTILAIAAR
jgi:hypothetical protein